MKRGNLFAGIPDSVPGEWFEELAGDANARIERIVSEGHASPEGFWYDQDRNEWVLVIEGNAHLKFEGEGEAVALGPGDWVDIPAHVRHRVEWTDPDRKTVWVAVFY